MPFVVENEYRLKRDSILGIDVFLIVCFRIDGLVQDQKIVLVP